MDLSPCPVKSKTKKFVFAASHLNLQHPGAIAKTGLL
jgi:hypothetical protein